MMKIMEKKLLPYSTRAKKYKTQKRRCTTTRYSMCEKKGKKIRNTEKKD